MGAMYSRSIAGVSCNTRRTLSKSWRCASEGGREFMNLALFSLVKVCLLENLLLNVSRLAIDIPSINFDAWGCFAFFANLICGGHLARFPGQQSEIVILPEHGQDFIVRLAFAADTVARGFVDGQVHRESKCGCRVVDSNCGRAFLALFLILSGDVQVDPRECV